MPSHRVSLHPTTTPGNRTAWTFTCTCGHRLGSYISEASAQAAGERHLTAVLAGAR